jgi:hypothetical protein
VRWPLWAYAAAVAFTRVMFGAHFPFDVIAGTVLGYASARLAIALLVETRLIEPLRGGIERAGYDQRVLDEPVQVLEPAAPGRFGRPPSPREAEA